MNAIVHQSRKLKKDSMIYGEGWNMPTILDEDMKANMENQAQMPEIGHFNDFFRDHIKGRTNQNEISVKGYCTGDVNYLPAIKSCMVGNVLNTDMVKLFGQPHQSINYVECHDNNTCWDKLKECCKEDTREIRIKKHKMIIGSILVAQGVPFLNSGQEFCRTKNGNHNSYRSSDNINQLDWVRRGRYDDVVRFTREMIELRKKNPAFRMTSAEEIKDHVSFSDIEGKVLIYHLHHLKEGSFEDIWVYFNPTSLVFYQNFPSYVTLIANEAGLINDYKVQNTTINPYTMVVFGL